MLFNPLFASERTVLLLRALADPVRLRLLQLLQEGERCVCELQEALGHKQPKTSFHLKVLKQAGFISNRQVGKWTYYSLQTKPLKEIESFLQQLLPHSTAGEHMSKPELKKSIQEKYQRAALQVAEDASCCGGGLEKDAITGDLYNEQQACEVPKDAMMASLGCGNPTLLAQLKPGEVVLDLGSGGGIDVLLSAKRVGPTGKAYGLDMTEEMLHLARENQKKAGATNVEFLQGEIENIPLPNESVDVILSNCVINLSGDKDRVLQEAFRVLRPGGRLAVSDVVVRGEVPPPIRRSMELWIGCVAGALQEQEYMQKLKDAGFVEASMEPTRIYRAEDAKEFLEQAGLRIQDVASAVENQFMSAFVRAKKPSLAT